jgi:pyridoxal/pyridoxine/pyridoxamine kinase
MAAFVMQSLGFEVAALNTVQFSMFLAHPDTITITDQDLRQPFRLWSV